jgi:hypothetical protein
VLLYQRACARVCVCVCVCVCVPTAQRVSDEQHSALLLAAHQGHRAVTHLLLEAGADVDQVGATGYYLGWCAQLLERQLRPAGLARRALVSVERGDSGAALSSGCACCGRTPLMRAAHGGHSSVAKVLLGAGAQSRIKNMVGERAEDIAREAGFDELARDILQQSRRRGSGRRHHEF